MIPVNEPLLTEKEIESVTDCLKTGWISSAGKYIDQFEVNWAEYCDRRYGVAVSNGTTALQLACKCINLQPGEEVILPSFTIISCAQSIIYESGRPVLVDCDPDLWTMNVDQVAEKITSKTRAIMPVHIYGHPVDMDAIEDLASDHNLSIIEDAAEAHGAEFYSKSHDAWKRCGGFGELSCFSFYANKLITTGEGGMVLTDDPEYAERLKGYRNLCFQPQQRFLHDNLGFNFRLTNVQAAIGVHQVERMPEIINKKRWIAEEYSKRLKSLPSLQLPIERLWAHSVYWMYALLIDEQTGMDQKEFSKVLSEKGIETRPFFLGMHEQPVFHRMGLFENEKYPVTERIARQGLYLPSGLTLTIEQIEYVCNCIKDVLT